ncbi:MAG TPA: hypothetical protein RMH99_08680 [Sandaracinaceae bacterium LLY-WYZ-13_1]|nr:hypothetical protein [Sandaracinaceae bacterium LLY-WYZ-13_1]
MTPAEAAAALAHDVGKYVARIARNVPPHGPVPDALVPLLVADLYALPGGERPSARFEALAAALAEDPRVERARAGLWTIDALEAAVRAGEDDACRRACAAALEVEASLRELAAERRA